jgi:hypothetical protein
MAQLRRSRVARLVGLGCLAILLILPGILTAQSVTGSIAGSVVDQTSQALPGAVVILEAPDTGLTRELTTSEDGTFIFTAVPPGVYTIRVKADGFSVFERRNTVLPASERLSVGVLSLTIGGITETIVATAQGNFVQTQSSERSALITSNQLELLGARGRDVVSIFRTLPGVSYQQDPDALGGGFGTTTPNIGGNRNTMNSMTVDGQLSNDLGSPQIFSSTTNFDAIGEVSVQLNNYRAEHGSNAGAVVNIVTKSGTRDYKGTAYWYRRHESLNANDFFNNRNNITKPLYRFSTQGGALGGPVPKMKNRVFFFYSFEDHNTLTPQPLRTVTVPTELERAGDFSQSREANGNLIVIRDPQTGQPFPGNKIPLDRISQNGLAILNVFPNPNALDRNVTRGAYNYTFQESLDVPKRQHVLRVDYRPNEKDQFYVRGKTWRSDSQGYAVPAGTSNWGLLGLHYLFTDQGLLGNWTRIVNSSVVNELSVGVRRSEEAGPPLDDDELQRRTRSAIGFTVGQFTPSINPLNIIPQALFTGVPGTPANITYDGRTPLTGSDDVFTLNNTLTMTRGNHAYKAGFYFEHVRNKEGATATFGGQYDFSRDASNPLDAGYAYANALLGNFRQYTESTSRPGGDGTRRTIEWFVQDTWRAARKLTLDYGLRFAHYTLWGQKDGAAAAFALERYDPSRAPRFYQPTLINGVRQGRDPVTGQTVPAVMIGAFVPGTGDPANGMVLDSDDSYPNGFREQPGLVVEPRFGASYDLKGDGKTALRASLGIFHNTRQTGNTNWTASRNPPLQFNPTLYYGTLAGLAQSTTVLFPSNVQGFVKEMDTPVIYSFTAGVQRDLGWNTVLDAAYVGSRSRDLLGQKNINKVPYGARFLPQNLDPTLTNTALADNFFRPYPGYGDITLYGNFGVANYDAFQMQVTRRFSGGFQFGFSYTLSETKDSASTDTQELPTYQDPNVWNYGLSAFDQTHVAVINYTWDLPDASKLWKNKVVAALLDGWQLSGITAFASGNPACATPASATATCPAGQITLQTTDNADLTGGGDGTRVVVNGDPTLSSGDRSLDRWFDTTVFARPGRGEIGNATKGIIRQPGIHVWDMTIFKNVSLGGRRTLQMRWEAYNVFNHTQFNTVDLTARFDTAGNQTNTNFGRVTSTRAPRTMQASLRFSF